MRSILMTAFLSVLLSSCGNFTVAPICNSENAAVPPGLTGTYSLSLQDPDTFEVQDQVLVIGEKAGTYKLPNRLGALADSAVCRINDMYISESYNEERRLYDQQRIFVTNVGVHFAPLMYDVSELADAGVDTKIISEEVRKLIGDKLANLVETAAAQIMVIDNYGIPATTILQTARTAPAGYHLLRK